MRVICGKIRSVDIKNRIFSILLKNKVEYFYLTRSQEKKFSSYLYGGLYVEFICSDKKDIRFYTAATSVINFIKMIRPINGKRQVYYDINSIKESVKEIIFRKTYRLFIDLEFSMPPYDYKKGNGFTAEIIQYGFVLQDDLGKVIYTEEGKIKPKNMEGINARTFNFIHLNKEDFTDAKKFYYFYDSLKNIMGSYQPQVYVWGKNDILMLDKAYNLYKLTPAIKRADIINLMQIIKNYYSIKNDVGLFNAYQLFKRNSPSAQDHNPLNDALATKEIFDLFIDEIKSK